ncbi:MAG: Sec-independent protein translocase protein TatB [Candidatus Omnitrophica bacterium]|nr:Sec-independent protein translocase protein TatB [Candidatus Omnitrophota bacterium]
MFNVGWMELAVIFCVALIVIGPRRLPEAARLFGRLLREFRKAADEFRAAMDASGDKPERSVSEYPPKSSTPEQ